MGEVLTKRRRMAAMILAIVLVIAAPLCIPGTQAHAMSTYQFNLLANGKNKSSVATKYVRGAAYTNVVASKTNTAMLSTCGVVLRVHTSSVASASDSVTRYTCGSKDLSYWSGYGGLNGSYQLWGQVAQSAGNTGTRVGGEWAP